MTTANQLQLAPVVTVEPQPVGFAPAAENMVTGIPTPQPAAVRLRMWDRSKISNPVYQLFGGNPAKVSQV